MNFVSRFFVPGLFEPYKVQSAKVQITPYTFELCRVQKAKAWTILNFVVCRLAGCLHRRAWTKESPELSG